MKALRGLILGGLLASVATSAGASVLVFSYTLDNGKVLSGNLNGTLEADHNRFDVSGYNSITYDGSPVVINPEFFESYTNYFGHIGTPTIDGSGVLTLDGSYLDFIDYNETTVTGFDLIVNVPLFTNFQDIATVGFNNLGDRSFDVSRYTASIISGVPEPGTWMTMLFGFGAIGTVLRRRRILRTVTQTI